MSLNLKDNNIESQSEQAQQGVYLCSEMEMKDYLHQECYARSCREIEELRICCYQEGNTEEQRRLEEFPDAA